MVEKNKPYTENYEMLEKDNTHRSYEQASTQLNHQDLDQVQTNTQNLHISMSDKSLGKIIGVIFSQENKMLLCNVEIFLYFGDKSKQPVIKIKSDNNGYFEFNDLPPGFYTLITYLDNLEYKFQYIKVSIGQIVFQRMPIAKAHIVRDIILSP